MSRSLGPDASDETRYTEGMTVRREVLGDAHVDRAIERTTEFTADFQDYITRTAWGDVWSRPGLGRRERSVAVLTAMMALGHHEEFEMHVRAARTNGLTVDEIKEVILQAGVYCGVPVANTAMRLAQRVLEEMGEL
ncbi:4-carboxymuconolactone decarboxylase [Leucobacter tenebrionis]|uniref:4-carboxymuconolactone decarboxylase n=1 Tax=Leucobacter tenebrionis TaxID=2873270 RepID=UPI001CA736C9|nr:4-carboxymuconolactone decarboxylase [Leucobacter tenebrionis]QZY51041.1 4-carboxymuconolactone decarboxylase [Leucobacter tenebrionis]